MIHAVSLMPPSATETFEQHRRSLMGLAYRMLGQVADAEDIVQEAWVRWSAVDARKVRDPRAFLVRITTRLAIDRLRRIKARREDYVGEWLPSPISTDAITPAAMDPAHAVMFAESVSMAMLVVLETLTPLERAVFVLHEAFGYTHAEIADSLGRSEVAVRQQAARARRHVDARRPRFETDPAVLRDVAVRFLKASRDGDAEALMGLLAPEVEFVADGGGLVRAPLLPVHGADRVIRFLLAAGSRMTPDQRTEMADLNGGPGIVSRQGETMIAAATLDIVDRRVVRILLVANPEKLAALRPLLSDVT
jgi:RNA polymerase sigma-70 factor (ECF subfamily)